MKTLITERLLLRNWHYHDVKSLYRFSKNPKVTTMAGFPPHKNIEESLAAINRFLEKGDSWAIYLKQSGQLIGSLGLHFDPKRRFLQESARMLSCLTLPTPKGRGFLSDERTVHF